MKTFIGPSIHASGQYIDRLMACSVRTAAEIAATEYIQRLLPIRVVVTDDNGVEWECEVGYSKLPPPWETLRAATKAPKRKEAGQ